MGTGRAPRGQDEVRPMFAHARGVASTRSPSGTSSGRRGASVTTASTSGRVAASSGPRPSRHTSSLGRGPSFQPSTSTRSTASAKRSSRAAARFAGSVAHRELHARGCGEAGERGACVLCSGRCHCPRGAAGVSPTSASPRPRAGPACAQLGEEPGEQRRLPGAGPADDAQRGRRPHPVPPRGRSGAGRSSSTSTRRPRRSRRGPEGAGRSLRRRRSAGSARRPAAAAGPRARRRPRGAPAWR